MVPAGWMIAHATLADDARLSCRSVALDLFVDHSRSHLRLQLTLPAILRGECLLLFAWDILPLRAYKRVIFDKDFLTASAMTGASTWREARTGTPSLLNRGVRDRSTRQFSLDFDDSLVRTQRSKLVLEALNLSDQVSVPPVTLLAFL